MTEREPDERYPHVDTRPSDHEEAVAEQEETGASDDSAMRTSRPTSTEDLEADRREDERD